MVDQRCQKIKKVIKVVFQDYRKLFKPTHRSSFIFFLTCFANVYILQQVFTKGKSIASQSVPNDERTYQKNLNEIPQNGHYREEVYLEILGNEEHYLATDSCRDG